MGSGQGEDCALSGLKGPSNLCLEPAFAPWESPTSHPGCLPCPLAIPNIICRGHCSWKAANTRPHPPPLLEVPLDENPSSAPRTHGDPVSGLPSLLWGGGIYQDTHTPTRVLFHLLLRQLTLLAVASWLPESQASSCGLHPPSSPQRCVHTQAGLRAQIAASSGTGLTSANLKLQGP